jgi:hypothetical protein
VRNDSPGNVYVELAGCPLAQRPSFIRTRSAATDSSYENWKIGTVEFDSGGIRTVGWQGSTRTLDWTLVKLNSTVTAKAMFNAPMGSLPGAFVPIEAVAPDRDFTKITDRVAKTGITSDLTQGRINGVFSPVRMSEQFPDLTTEEMCVVPCPGYHDFSRPGDSGAWVVTGTAVVGMVLGGSDLKPYRTYVADMRHVFEDIHRVTKLVPTIPADLSWEPDLALQKGVIIYQGFFTSSSPVVRLLRGPHLLNREQVVSFQVSIPNDLSCMTTR